MSEEAQAQRVADYKERSQKEYEERKAALTSSNPAQIPINSVLKQAAEIDNNIQVRTDLFNAATVAIVEIKKAIDDDVNIVNKPYALAETLKNRFDHFKTVVFELNQQLVEAGNQQKAIQIYLNTLSNTLRAEEREKLKISDINYKPAPPKIAKERTKSAVSTTTTKKKLDKSLLRKTAAELNVSEFTLQMLCVSKGISIESAATMLKASLEAAKG